MPRGLNRVGDYHHGNPMPPADSSYDSNPVDWNPDPAHFGNPVVEPKNFGNPVTWPTPDPSHFGNTGESQ